jgi:hypothetical protein
MPIPQTLPLPQALCLAEAYTVNDGCMVEFIADDCVIRPQQCLKEACVCVKAAGVQDGVLRAMEGADARL